MIGGIIEYLASTKELLWLRRIPRELLRRSKRVMISFNYEEVGEIFNLMDACRKEVDMQLNYLDAYQLFVAVRSVKKIKGDIAEVGTYRGGSAKLICEAKEDKPLHLFDTFGGMPEINEEVDLPIVNGAIHRAIEGGGFNVSLEQVKNYLKEYKDVYFYKGLFPITAEPVKGKSFSFVHLDVDIYKSTMDCLNFFYPRMSKGGIILVHDYRTLPGVTRAVNEFFIDQIEPIIESSSRAQCLVIKL